VNIPAGTAVRFEPGQKREVTLVQVSVRSALSAFAAR
jgi:urease subunit beta